MSATPAQYLKTTPTAVEGTTPPLTELLQRPVNRTSFDVLLEKDHHDQLARTALTFSKATLLPGHWRGKAEDIFTVLCRAYSLQIDPMLALEQMFVISGRIGMSAQLAIALANNSGKLRSPIEWTVDGTAKDKTLTVTATATLWHGKPVSVTVDWALAIAEGWTKNSKYQTMPDHMLMWRSATWLIRRYIPEVLLGMPTADELQDVAAAEGKPVTPMQEPPPVEVDDQPEPPKDDEPPAIDAGQKKFIEAAISAFHFKRDGWKQSNEIESITRIPAADFPKIREKLLNGGFAVTENGIDGAEDINALTKWAKAVTFLERSNHPDAPAMRELYEGKKTGFIKQ